MKFRIFIQDINSSCETTKGLIPIKELFVVFQEIVYYAILIYS